jgi:hypothetical protein
MEFFIEQIMGFTENCGNSWKSIKNYGTSRIYMEWYLGANCWSQVYMGYLYNMESGFLGRYLSVPRKVPFERIV